MSVGEASAKVLEKLQILKTRPHSLSSQKQMIKEICGFVPEEADS